MLLSCMSAALGPPPVAPRRRVGKLQERLSHSTMSAAQPLSPRLQLRVQGQGCHNRRTPKAGRRQQQSIGLAWLRPPLGFIGLFTLEKVKSSASFVDRILDRLPQKHLLKAKSAVLRVEPADVEHQLRT